MSMITRESVAAKLRDRLERKNTATQLTHWAKAGMFGFYEGKQTYEPGYRDLLERIIFRIANSSTNYRTFLYGSEIVKLIEQLGQTIDKLATEELYKIHLIIIQRENEFIEESVEKVANLLSEGKHCIIQQQRMGFVVNADSLNEDDIHQLSVALQDYNFLMWIDDYSA
ncbi:MAG: hypothetical protein AB1489_20730 [Acidobacteriota bacterium]